MSINEGSHKTNESNRNHRCEENHTNNQILINAIFTISKGTRTRHIHWVVAIEFLRTILALRVAFDAARENGHRSRYTRALQPDGVSADRPPFPGTAGATYAQQTKQPDDRCTVWTFTASVCACASACGRSARRSVRYWTRTDRPPCAAGGASGSPDSAVWNSPPTGVRPTRGTSTSTEMSHLENFQNQWSM